MQLSYLNLNFQALKLVTKLGEWEMSHDDFIFNEKDKK